MPVLGKTRKDVIREFRTAELLEAARKVFAKRGFHAATVEDIAAAAGVAKGTVYLYYRSKQEVYWAALEHGITELLDEIRATMAADAAPEDKIRAFIAVKIRYFERNRDFFRIYFSEVGSGFKHPCNYPGVLKQCTSSKRDCSKPPFSRASDGSKSARSVRTRRPWPSATWSGALSCSGFLDGLKRTLNPTSASSSISFGEESQRENQRMDENSSARLPPVRMGSRARPDESGCGRQLGSKHRNGTEHEHLAEHSSARCNRKPVHGQRSAGSRAAESAASFFERRHQPCSEVQPGNPSERARDGTGARRQDLCTQQAAAPDFCGDLGIGRADQPEGSGLPIIPGSAAHHRAVRRL